MGVAGQLVLTGGADDFGYLGVCVEGVEVIIAGGEGGEDGPVIELAGELEAGGVGVEGVEIGKNFAHATLLDAEGALHDGRSEAGDAHFQPIAGTLARFIRAVPPFGYQTFKVLLSDGTDQIRQARSQLRRIADWFIELREHFCLKQFAALD